MHIDRVRDRVTQTQQKVIDENNALIYAEGSDAFIFDEYNFDPEHFLQKLNEFNSLDLKELSKKVKKDLHCEAALNIANEIKQNKIQCELQSNKIKYIKYLGSWDHGPMGPWAHKPMGAWAQRPTGS